MDWQKEHKNNKQNLTYTHSHRHQQTEKARPNLKQEKAKRKKSGFHKERKIKERYERAEDRDIQSGCSSSSALNREQSRSHGKVSIFSTHYIATNFFWDPDLLQRHS